jgi:hypothetical protein
MKICIVDGCDKKQRVKAGYCSAHNYKYKTHGDPLGGRRGASPGAPLAWIISNKDYQGEDCLVWPFAISRYGYGTIKHSGKRRVASRVMCEYAHGMPDDQEMHAAHECGNGHKGCMNPKHLSWKTRKENEKDKIRHGTLNRGSKVHNAKLTEAQALEIAKLKGEFKQSDLAKMYGVSVAVIAHIHSGGTWLSFTDGNHLKKSKFAYGKDHCCAKIDENDVRKIRELRGKLMQWEIGEMFGIDRSQVGKIQRREWWKWVD